MTAMTRILKHNPLAGLFKGHDGDRVGDRTGEVFYIVHPLYDEPEEKCDPEALGPLKLSKGEKLSLYALRGYLVLMLGLAAYRVAEMAGLFGPHLVR
jgi:hypothetical protein